MQALLPLVPYIAMVFTLLIVMVIVKPYIIEKKFEQRLKNVVHERDEMRDTRLKQLKLSRRGRGVKVYREGFFAKLMHSFKIEQFFKVDVIKSRLKMAGMRSQKHLTSYLLGQVILPVVFLLVALLMVNIYQISGTKMYLIPIVSIVLGFYSPYLYVNNKVAKRQDKLRSVTAEMFDLLLICVRSGISVEAAFLKVGSEIETRCEVMAEEIHLLNAELSYLPNRKQAFDNFGTRTGLKPIQDIMTSLVQSEKYGTPVSQSLRVTIRSYREETMAKAEKKAASLPPLLTGPMLLFFLPAVFVIVIVPTVLRFLGY